MSVEKREFTRVPCSSFVRCRQGEARDHFGEILDISRTGARLIVDGPAPSQMRLEFEGKFSLDAHTVWTQLLPTGKRMVGVRFEKMQLAQKCSLGEYLAVQIRAEVSRLFTRQPAKSPD